MHFRQLKLFLAVAVASGFGVMDAHAAACNAGETAQVFSFTGAEQTFTVPAFVNSVRIVALGAQGGDGASGGNGAAGGTGGLGGSAVGTLSVSPGQSFSVYVGGRGNVFNGGGLAGNANAGIGGGASDVRTGGNAVANRVLVAGGGGGGGRAGCELSTVTGGNGGSGGGGNGVNGTDAPTPSFSPTGVAGGGFGGTPGTGGAAGIGCAGFLGQVGATTATEIGGQGGNGQSCCCFTFGSIPGGGGGGGGALGGGGGGGGSAGTTGCSGNDKGGGGGGGGGTSANFLASSVTMTPGVQAGDGDVTFCYSVTPQTAADIPTLSTYALAAFAVFMALGAGAILRNRKS